MTRLSHQPDDNMLTAPHEQAGGCHNFAILK
jgi:hypothetical protein